MIPFHTQEAIFAIPGEWRDTSINIFSVGSEVAGEFSFVITRDRIGPGVTLLEFAEGQLKQLSKAVNGITMVEQRQRSVADVVALEAEFIWKSDKGTMYQRQTYVPCADRERVLILTATALDFIDDDRSAQIDALLDSFSFRD
jgi:hypothetical protein